MCKDEGIKMTSVLCISGSDMVAAFVWSLEHLSCRGHMADNSVSASLQNEQKLQQAMLQPQMPGCAVDAAIAPTSSGTAHICTTAGPPHRN